MKKLNNYNLLNKKCVILLCHCLFFICLQLKLSFAQTNDFNKEVSSSKINTEIKVSKLAKPSLGSLGVKTEVNNLMGLNIWQNLKVEEIMKNTKYEYPEGYLDLFHKSKDIFLMWRDKITVDNIIIHTSQKNMAELLQFLVGEIEMNEKKVQNGIKKIMNYHNFKLD